MTPDFDMKLDAVYFVPLGGCGIFGANMALYGYQGQWVMLDCGMGFADDTMPGVDVLLPDPSFAESLGDSLLAIVLTHGHEDHIGAIGELWPRLKAPLYATGFTAARIKQSLAETSWGDQVEINTLPESAALDIGPFHLQYVPMAHSIPEGNAVAIKVKEVGTVLHTGDWKIDPEPVVGHLTDAAALKKLGDEGVIAVMGDSTNAMVPGHSGSEGEVGRCLIDLFSEFNSKIIISCFSTNIARIHSIATAAEKNGRQVCLVGRSLWRADEAARQTGYLQDLPPFLEAEEAVSLPDSKVVYICTGSQGEPRAALSKIASGEHRYVGAEKGDVVIFSSRAIPGNERAISRVKNRLYINDVSIMTDREAPVHVSGHPYRDELKKFYGWTRPKICIPVHGEIMQQEKHGKLAEDCGITMSLIPKNGNVIEITKDNASVIAHVQSAMLALEGGRVVEMDHEAILMRRRIMYNGSAVVTVVVDARGDLLADPRITAMGLLDESSDVDMDIIYEAEAAAEEKMRNLPKGLKRDDAALEEEIRIVVRKFFTRRFDRKPQTRVHLMRIDR